MHQEDDLRGLANVMHLMRGVAALTVLIHIYWYCYGWIAEMNLNAGIVDRILVNIQHSTGLFSAPLYSKLFCSLFLILSCLGTRGRKSEGLTWRRITICGSVGLCLFFLNGWLLSLSGSIAFRSFIYSITLVVGFFCLLTAGVWISRLLSFRMLDDPFNVENESFEQETRRVENEYSINLPTRFYYKRRWHDGWINVINPFRASIVLGTPGSGKSFAVINNYIKQSISKGYSMFLYDFKFPDLSVIAYNHLLKNLHVYKVPPKFYIINFDDPRRSHRCNPINPDFMTDISDAYESAYVILLNLNKTWV